jgi:ankyrin repeat protein
VPATELTGKSSDLLKIVLPAAARGDLASVQRFVEANRTWIYRVGPHNRTMLWEACYRKRLETVRYLIEAGADVNAAATYWTPLIVDLPPYCLAVRAGQKELETLLVENGATLDLHSAVYLGEADRVHEFLEANPEDVNSVYPGSSRVLLDPTVEDAALPKVVEDRLQKIEADREREQAMSGSGSAFRSSLDALTRLIETKQTAAARRRLLLARRRWIDRWTLSVHRPGDNRCAYAPIHYAVAAGRVDMVRSLVERGAEVAPYSRDLIEWSDRDPSGELRRLIIESGANVGQAACTDWILESNKRDLAEEHGVELSWESEAGKSPLLVRRCTANMNATDDPARVRPLLDRGAPVDIRDYKGKTALHRAAKAGFQKITRLLIERGADLEAVDQDGETPIFEAVRHGRLEATRLLLEHGASPHVENGKGTTLEGVAARARKNQANEVRDVVRQALAPR